MDRNPVKFRVAVATSGSYLQESGLFNQGFAFDNFFIGKKTRRTLLEFFTNSASDPSSAAGHLVDSLAARLQSSVIDLHYHTDFPGNDPMNENNPAPASTRSFYYGVQQVPFLIVNGGITGSSRFDFSSPSQTPTEEVLLESTQVTPSFGISLTVDYRESDLEVFAEVTCEADTFDSNLQLYVVVLEREVEAYTGDNQDTVFRNVVLDMLPTAAGTLLGDGWNFGRSVNRTFQWDYPVFIEDVEDLSVVAFVQDREAGEVLQAIQKPLTPGVGIQRKAKREPGSISLFPNPASDQVFLNFGRELRHSGILRCTDLSGREMWRGELDPGHQIYRLDLSGLDNGIYLIQWIEPGASVATGKLVIQR